VSAAGDTASGYRRSMDPVVRKEPREPEEERPVDEYGFEPVERGYEPIHPSSPWRDMLRKFWAPIALVGFLLWKFKAAFAAIFKLKLFTVVGSAFVSVAAYALIWGWQFGLGFVLLLFVHELGHVAVAKYQGLPVSAPVFIPFMGALILMKEMPQNAWREAQIALGGPIVGALGAAACWGLGESMDSDLLRALAYVGFFLNLFNLIPVLPLDGGRAIGAVHPVFWVLGAAVLVVAAVLWLSPVVLLLVALLGGFELYGRAKDWWRNRGTPGGNRYYAITPWQRIAVGAVYVGLSAVLVLGMAATQVPQDRL
jgi:Zn-dependent protease